ncbi:MAG: Nif3-like dinuclear metal center hexameric protein [Mycoplasmataceae bacterium]|nr:Nif3-like dinuclear metal center hexameric protein [Mycoplasmataceae bacterium]
MIRINKILNKLNSKYPLRKSAKWDNVGLIFGNSKRAIKNVLVALDLTTKVFEEAIKNEVELLIIYHPFLFEDNLEKEFEKAPWKKELIERIEGVNISVYIMHTAYNVAKEGTPTQVFNALGIEKTKSIKGTNYGRKADIDMTIRQIKSVFKDNLNLNVSMSNSKISRKKYKSMAIYPGSGDIVDLINSKQQDIDIVVSSDIKWSEWITLEEMGIIAIQISHCVEKVFSKDIYLKMEKWFPMIDTKFSETNEITKL